MAMNKNNTPEIIDTYEGYNLYEEGNGYYVAKSDFPIYVDHISFFENSYCIQTSQESITGHSDWQDCQDEVEEALEAAQHFLKEVGGHL